MIRAVAGLNLLGGRNGPCPDGGIIAETGHCFQAHVTARHGTSMVCKGGRAMSITEELAKILARVDRPGDFYAVGRTELLAPRIEVKGVGPIALPLLAAQAKQLIKAATRAPFGRGAETIVDTNVRRTWQIEGSRVAIGGKHWAQTLAGIVQRAVEGLGVTGPVTAPLYKLLIYDMGSFFVSHRDTEKVPGMFATLVLALPS